MNPKNPHPIRSTFIKYSLLGLCAMAGASLANASTDYGPAVWRPACSGKWYTSGNGHKFVVIHDMEGYYLASISYLNQCGVSASVHYAVNGIKDSGSDAPAGEVSQMVREAYYAWHATCWNTHSLGTEHEGFVSNPAWYTEAMYQASADLQRHLCNTFGIPKDRNHVIGHDQKRISGWPSYASGNLGIDPYCNDHTDPGLNWNWSHFMDLIQDTSAGKADHVHVFGRGTDGACWIKTWNSNGGWNEWYSLGGNIVGGPDAYSRNPDHVGVVVRSATEPGHIKAKYWTTSTGWSGWSDLGGNMTSDPSAVARGANVWHVFARGTDGACWKLTYTEGSGWSAWDSLGGNIVGSPDSYSKNSGHVGVVVRSATEPGHIKAKVWTSSGGWGGWSDLWTAEGGNMTSDPSAVVRGDGKVHVFARGSDGACWIRTHTDGTGWANWYSLGGNIVGGPDAFSRGGDHVAVVVRSATEPGHFKKKTWTDTDGWGGWEDLEGDLTSDPGAVAR